MPRLLVIGAGIAGLSTASEAAADFDVSVIEAELQPGYHSSGRSAAVFVKPFINDVVHRLSVASENFFLNPPQGFEALARPLANVLVAEHGTESAIDDFLDAWSGRCPWLKRIQAHEVRELVPIIGNSVACGALDEQNLALDVHNLLDGHRRRLLERGGQLVANARVLDITRNASTWQVELEGGKSLSGDLLVDAAGAWADEIAVLAGVQPIGLQPKRRTGILVDPKTDVSAWPMTHVTTGDLYFKPEGPLLMVSPADEADSAPCDAQPEELDIAMGMDRFDKLTTAQVDRPVRSWAGLRSFVVDKTPVIGFDPNCDTFFWVAALGGFGVQTSPAYGPMAAALLRRESVPEEAFGVDTASVAPDRLDRALGEQRPAP